MRGGGVMRVVSVVWLVGVLRMVGCGRWEKASGEEIWWQFVKHILHKMTQHKGKLSFCRLHSYQKAYNGSRCQHITKQQSVFLCYWMHYITWLIRTGWLIPNVVTLNRPARHSVSTSARPFLACSSSSLVITPMDCNISAWAVLAYICIGTVHIMLAVQY